MAMSGVAGLVVVAVEHAESDLRHLDEIGHAGLGKVDLQLCGRMAQQDETCADDLPVFLGVAGGRQGTNGGERGFEAGNSGESAR